MGLIKPNGPDWAYCSHNLASTPSETTPGLANVTAGLSNADGSAVTIMSALAHDVEYLRLLIACSLTSGAVNDILMDLLIDPAGGTSWSVLIPSIMCCKGDLAVGGGSPGSFSGYDFPVWIPAGASLGAQARCAETTLTAPVIKPVLFAYGGNANPASWWCGQRVTAIGINASASTGQAHTPGSSGSFSTWTNLGSTLDTACGALQWGVNGEGDGTFSTGRNQWEFGVASNRIGAPVLQFTTTSEAATWTPTGPIFKRLVAGTQLQVRATSAASPAQPIGVAAYAVH